ncbi:YHS domain-containing (seleno)protein [Methylobacterium aerolatum]|uniref:YHS domain-containing protein n=1 Tax=Methylobacterium aerolatum TaxID=418708 RepID=A0ABU0I1B9_9HYPH|nr:YHS domain-containing (seleno)protein [Methylobacterium aerolatum]MDQ0448396.1 YHS domain-containing protein [Methylobacterium aerolatum]GJD34478.1 hypothetical protein FMGBMHLM_1379 [Methylobacterium aerolatum]
MRLTGGDRRSARWAAWCGAWIVLLLGLAAGVGRGAAEPVGTRVTLLALRGYDPVSYFLPDGPRPGSARFETVWAAQAWRFASEANRAAFRRDPEVYAPRLGGFDAAGILDRRLVDSAPDLFAIIGERLYLFRNEERRARFLAQPDLASTAETIWPELRVLLDDPPPVPASPAAKPPESRAVPLSETPGEEAGRSPPEE